MSTETPSRKLEIEALIARIKEQALAKHAEQKERKASMAGLVADHLQGPIEYGSSEESDAMLSASEAQEQFSPMKIGDYEKMGAYRSRSHTGRLRHMSRSGAKKQTQN